MKSRTFVSILILILVVLLISSCATTSKTKVVSRTEPLSSDKSYFAGVFDYHFEYFAHWLPYDPHSPILRLLGDNEERVIMEFPSPYTGGKKPSGILLVVVEVEPGEYTAESIFKVVKYSNFRFGTPEIMMIPPNLKDKITVGRGSITYLGDFSIMKCTQRLFKVVSFECKYNYDFEKFRNRLMREYIVPENIELHMP